MDRVYIAAALRTPTGKLLGKLSSISAPHLSSIVIKELMERARLLPKDIDEVIMGNVISAGVGQNPARQAAIYGGLLDATPAFTVNKVCASGMKAIALGAQAIRLGEAKVVIAGGMESMSNAPFLLRELRRGKKYGDSELTDAMIYDGLWDCYYGASMGRLCELTVKKYNISRQEQDRFALESHRKAATATEKGFFKNEIAPVPVSGTDVTVDETVRFDTDLKKLSRLAPVFDEKGTITAGNSPGLNDGAAAVVLASESAVKELKVEPLAEIIGYSSGHTDPKWYTLAPVKSVKALLKKTGLRLEDFDLIEENEAFAAQTLAVAKELSIDMKKLNVNGGAIALGHPIGASGARIIVRLTHALRNRNKRVGLATLCLGGGGAMSMAIKAI